MHKWLILTLLITLSVRLTAQEREELYYPYTSPYDEPYRPMIQSDTTLFYRAIQLPQNPYEELTRYTFSHLATAYRGEPFRAKKWLLEGLELSYRNFATLRTLGATIVGPTDLSAFRESAPTSHRLGLHASGRRYNLGVRYTGNIPLKEDGQVALYADGRMGRDLFIRGVGSRTLRLAVQFERRFSERWRWSLTGSVAPTREARAGMTTQACFDLTGSNYYNPSWGFDKGRERSARIRREWLPMVASTVEFSPSATTQLRLSLLFEGGQSRQGGLGWFNATTPMPDNYRKLPSYFADGSTSEAVAARWRAHDSRYTQIDWQELRAENRLSDEGARYVEQEAVERLRRGSIGIEGESLIGRGMRLRYGAQASLHRSRNYLQLKDLLDAEWLLDIDYYLIDDDTYANSLENDVRHPQRRVVEGDRFGYDYALQEYRLMAHADMEYLRDRWHLNLGLCIEGLWLHREGYYEKELFAGSGSYGRSATIGQSPYRLDLAAGYAFTPRHYLGLRGTARSEMPEAEQLFLQSEYNNRTIDNPTPERYYEAELMWRSSGRNISWSATLFMRLRRDGCSTDHLYDDLSGLFCDRVTTRIGERYLGFEGTFSYYLSRQWRLHLALTALEARYVDNPLVTLYADRDNRLIATEMESYMGDCRPGGVPQLAAMAQVSYLGRGWGADLECSYAGLRYAHPDFQRRTLRTLQTSSSPEGFSLLMSQEQLRDAYRINLSAWKSFSVGDYRLVFYVRLENLLGDERTPSDSFEQGRIQRTYVGGTYRWSPFDNRLSYAPPRNLYLSFSFHF